MASFTCPLLKFNLQTNLQTYSFYKPKPLPLVLNFNHNYDKKTNHRRVNLRSSCLANNTFSVDNNCSIPLTKPLEKNLGRISPSGTIVVKTKKRAFWGRKWNLEDKAIAGAFLAVHLLSLFAPFYFTWRAFWVAVGLYVVTGNFGVTLGYHRNLTHKSFKLPKWLEFTFAYCGVQAFQKDPIYWVSTHRFHHQFSDTERDPHSPIEGFWFSHINWVFDTQYAFEKCGARTNVGDLEKQPFYKFLQKTYYLHPAALGVLLYALGGFPFLVWGMGVRVVCILHVTFLVNSACHMWGDRPWKTNDLSRNNWLVALFTGGEGWHNNHHEFEFSARHGLEWWQIDTTWYIVRFLEIIGMATEVKLPTKAQKQKLAFKG